ncbi:MAG: tetratricopeptide repeat protein [Oligoflexus sp.]
MTKTFALWLLLGIPPVMVTEEVVGLQAQTAPQQTMRDWQIAQARPRKRPSTAIQQQLRRADQLFQGRDYERASFLYTQILKRSPDTLAARINLARCLYKLGRFDDSFRAFQNIKLDELDPEARYEVGQSALKVKDFAKALEAFKAVPSGHPLYDLANYYGAICASNLQEYRQAAELMRQAVVLPSKLTPSKKAYLQHIQEMMAQQEAAEAKKEALRPETPPPLPKEEPVIPQAFGSGFGPNPGHSLAIAFRSTIQNQEYIDSPKLRHERQEPYLEWQVAKRLPLQAKQEEPHNMLLHFRLNLSQLTQNRREMRMIEDENQELRRLFRQKNQGQQDLMSEVDTGILPQWHIGQDMWLVAGGQFIAVSPGVDLGSSFSHLIGVVGFGLQKKDFEALLRLRLIDTGGDAKRQYTRTQQEVDLHLLPQGRFTIGIHAKIAQYSYSQPEIDGPDYLSLFHLNSRLKIGSIASIGAGGFIERLDGQRYHNLNEIPVIGFNQTTSGGQVDLKFEPFWWLKLELGVRTANRIFEDLLPAEVEPAQALQTRQANSLFEVFSQAALEWQF